MTGNAAGGSASQAGRTEESIRTDLIARVKNEIAAGTYETTAKLDAALERLLDDIA